MARAALDPQGTCPPFCQLTGEGSPGSRGRGGEDRSPRVWMSAGLGGPLQNQPFMPAAERDSEKSETRGILCKQNTDLRTSLLTCRYKGTEALCVQFDCVRGRVPCTRGGPGGQWCCPHVISICPFLCGGDRVQVRILELIAGGPQPGS